MKYLLAIGFVLLCAITSNAQDVCPSPNGCALVTREVLAQALKDSDAVKALTIETTALKQALNDQKKVTDDMRLEFANVSGQNTELRQHAVETRAIIKILVENSRKRCAPLSILCL